MLIWIETRGKQTHLTGFNGSDDCFMKAVVHLIEKDNKWIMRALEDEKWSKIESKGNGCTDPAEFIERMISPNVNPESKPKTIMEYNVVGGDSFQVWDPD